MKLFRVSTILAGAAAVLSGTGLFWVSQSVQESESRLYMLERSIESEREAIRVLRAEWDYLNRPERLEVLAEEYLGLESANVEALSGDAARIPGPVTLPFTPARKPQISRNAVFTEPAPAVAEDPAPKAAPVPPFKEKSLSPGRDFEDLLGSLSLQGSGS